MLVDHDERLQQLILTRNQTMPPTLDNSENSEEEKKSNKGAKFKDFYQIKEDVFESSDEDEEKLKNTRLENLSSVIQDVTK